MTNQIKSNEAKVYDLLVKLTFRMYLRRSIPEGTREIIIIIIMNNFKEIIIVELIIITTAFLQKDGSFEEYNVLLNNMVTFIFFVITFNIVNSGD